VRYANGSLAPSLLLTLTFGLLQALLCAEHALANDRVLRVQDGAVTRQYAVTDLIAAIGLTELRVSKDPHFGPDRVFAGFALKPLLNHIGLGDAAELILVCADGYSIPFDAALLSQPALRGLLALRDKALPADGETHWAAFRQGAELVSFDPFYLVWTSADESIDLGTEVMPWPFQLTEIRRFDRERYFAPAQPQADADDALRKGFGVYTAHCGKCHHMRGVGGDVGPALDRDGSLSSILTATQLRNYVRHDESRFPQSKMPPFSTFLSTTEIDQVVAYLQAMQPAR
jgi:mono/diheme cytochrome c family protein